jgi:hypothetical protein
LSWGEKLYRFLFGWWDQRSRDLDLHILWPSFKRQAKTLEQARTGFLIHMASDPAYFNMTEDEIRRFVEEKLV